MTAVTAFLMLGTKAEAMDDAYMQGRAADVKDVSNRLLSQFAKNRMLHLK